MATVCALPVADAALAGALDSETRLYTSSAQANEGCAAMAAAMHKRMGDRGHEVTQTEFV